MQTKSITKAQAFNDRLDKNVFKLENAKSALLVLALDESIGDKSVSGAIHAAHDLLEFALKDIRGAMADEGVNCD